MSLERAEALVIRGTDWSESSRIVTLWTREFGKVRALAKGGRRLKSSFESSLDLLSSCSIVLFRKTSGALDLLTEASVKERFPHLRQNLHAWYAGQYAAELLGDWTQDHDPHPILYDEALAMLRDLGAAGEQIGPRTARFELVLLRELGYGPALEHCVACGAEIAEGDELSFSAAKGGVLCRHCGQGERGHSPLALAPLLWKALRDLSESDSAWRTLIDPELRQSLRWLLNDYINYALARRPRLQPYLRS